MSYPEKRRALAQLGVSDEITPEKMSKTVQELLRHANSRITLDVYTQAVDSNKRAAQSKVVKMMVPNLGEIKDEKTFKMGGRTLTAPISNQDFDVTIGPYVP